MESRCLDGPQMIPGSKNKVKQTHFFDQNKIDFRCLDGPQMIPGSKTNKKHTCRNKSYKIIVSSETIIFGNEFDYKTYPEL